MFSFKVITLLLTLCTLDKISAQENPKLESRWLKLFDAVDKISAQENPKLESRRLPLNGLFHESDETSAQINPEEETPLNESCGSSEEISAPASSEVVSRRAKLFGLWDKTSAQKTPKEESSSEESSVLLEVILAEVNSRRAKLMEILQHVVDKYYDKSINSSISVEKWLKKPLIELTVHCGSGNTLAKKIKSYNYVLSKIVDLIYPTEILESVDVHSIVRKLWENLHKIVFFEDENCLDDGDVSLDVKEKLHVMAIIFKEIAERLTYTDLTLEDEKCFLKATEKSRVCFLQPFELREEPLFHVLLGDLKPKLGTCEENLAIKKCTIDHLKECSEKVKLYNKLALSPPGGIPCENLETL